ncbi:hypothetical protein SJS32_02455, partial [Aeromonas caviae]|nr:hypothetical protein [Aeromonas caviae]
MAHLVGLLVGLAQGWLDRHHRPGCRQFLGNQSDHQHGSPGGSAGRPCPRLAGQAPQASLSRFIIKKRRPKGRNADQL